MDEDTCRTFSRSLYICRRLINLHCVDIAGRLLPQIALRLTQTFYSQHSICALPWHWITHCFSDVLYISVCKELSPLIHQILYFKTLILALKLEIQRSLSSSLTFSGLSLFEAWCNSQLPPDLAWINLRWHINICGLCRHPSLSAAAPRPHPPAGPLSA